MQPEGFLPVAYRARENPEPEKNLLYAPAGNILREK